MNYRDSELAKLGREKDYAQYREERMPWFMAIISLFIILMTPLFVIKGAIELFQIVKEMVGWGEIFLMLFLVTFAIFLRRLLLARQHIRVAGMMQ